MAQGSLTLFTMISVITTFRSKSTISAGTYYHYKAGVNPSCLNWQLSGLPIIGSTEIKKKKYILKPIWFYLLFRIERYFRA